MTENGPPPRLTDRMTAEEAQAILNTPPELLARLRTEAAALRDSLATSTPIERVPEDRGRLRGILRVQELLDHAQAALKEQADEVARTAAAEAALARAPVPMGAVSVFLEPKGLKEETGDRPDLTPS